MPSDTGFPRADVENDFIRARRRQILARLAQRLRREPDDINLILPFDDVVSALGSRGERELGMQTIRLDTVVGTVDSQRDFDRHFVPPPGECVSGGNDWLSLSGAASLFRLSTSTGSVSCTLSRTATTGCRSRWPRDRR